MEKFITRKTIKKSQPDSAADEKPVEIVIPIKENWEVQPWKTGIAPCLCDSDHKLIVKNLASASTSASEGDCYKQICQDCYMDYPGSITMAETLWKIHDEVLKGKSQEDVDKYAEYFANKMRFLRALNWIRYTESGIKDAGIIIAYIDAVLAKLLHCSVVAGCAPMQPCYDCFYKRQANTYLNDKQKQVLWKVHNAMFDQVGANRTDIITGFPGTGKTTLLRFLIAIPDLADLFALKELRIMFGENREKEAIQNRLDRFKQGSQEMQQLVDIMFKNKTVILSAPTNKALDVIKEKMETSPNELLDIKFLTVSKLLRYKKFYDKNHELIFRRPQNVRNLFDAAHLTIIDECSMISKQNYDDISKDLAATAKTPMKGYLLFLGDNLQLPPPKERFSSVFGMFKQKHELTDIMRTDKDNIMQISNFIRKWINGQILDERNLRADMMRYACGCIKFFTDKTKFIEDYMQHISDAVILVWTNKTREMYNTDIRNRLMRGRKDKYFVGERLIFNSFYKIMYMVGRKKKIETYYSSMPITVASIKIDSYICEFLKAEAIIKEIEMMSADELEEPAKFAKMQAYIESFVEKFNRSMERNYKVWVMTFRYKGHLMQNPLRSIYSPKEYDREMITAKGFIKNYFEPECKFLQDQWIKENVRELVIKAFDEAYIQPFADLDYGYCMTVDKSQGSTFQDVYVDAPDILNRDLHGGLDLLVAKKRFYTGLTRSAERVNILL